MLSLTALHKTMEDLASSPYSTKCIKDLGKELAQNYWDSEWDVPDGSEYAGYSVYSLRMLLIAVCATYYALEVTYQADEGLERSDPTDTVTGKIYRDALDQMYAICVALDK